MKKLTILMLSLILLSGLTIANANNYVERGYISVNANEDKEISPDTAKLVFTVETQNTDLQKAVQENNELSAKLLPILKAKLGDNDTIKTSTYRVVPQYKTQSSKRVFDKYVATNQVIITTKNISNLSELIALGLKNGATSLDSLNFSIAEYDSFCNNLIKNATNAAKQQANLIAETLGTTLNGAKSLHASCNSSQSYRSVSYDYKRLQVSSAVEETALAPQIEAGTIKINANVNASFFIK